MLKRSFLEDFFHLLNTEKIEYCVLRNYYLLPKSTGESDLDIWVGRNDYDRFFTVLKIMTDKHEGVIVSYIWKRLEPKICLLGKDWGLQLDVYKELVPIQEYPFFSGNVIRKHISKYQGIAVINEKWSNLETFLKEVLNTNSCDRKPNIFPDAQKALSVITLQELKDDLTIFSMAFLELLHCIPNKAYSQALISKIYKLGVRDIKKQSNRYYFDRIRKYGRFLKRPGYFIVILGTDGSGKSTIINAITPILKGAFHKGVHYKHLRPHLIPDIGVILGKRENKVSVITSTHPHAKKQSGFLGSLFRWSYYMIDYIIGYFVKIFPIISTQSHLFILDRYYFDYYIDKKRSLINLPNWILRIGEFFIPQPDLILCLGGDSKIIFERKPETSIEEVERQVKTLKKFSEKRKNAVWVDSTSSIDETVDASMQAITEMMSIRFVNIKSI